LCLVVDMGAGRKRGESWRSWPGPDSKVLDLFLFALHPARESDWALLEESESRRAQRLVIPSKRDQFVLSRANVRRVLAAATARSAESLQFRFGAHDKPFLQGQHPLAFNLSHSHQLAVIGVLGRDVQLGVDIEYMRDGRAFESIAGSFFSHSEQAILTGIRAAQGELGQKHGFYRAWSRKEAYLKAIGTGLSFASSRFSIEFREEMEPKLLATEAPGDSPEKWRMLDLEIDPEYAAAVCLDQEIEGCRFWQMDL